MKKPELQFIRKRHLILNADGSLYQNFKSVSAAKRFSRLKQKSTGGLGCGTVQVDRSDDPKPPQLNFNKTRAFVRQMTSTPPKRVSIEEFVIGYKQGRV